MSCPHKWPEAHMFLRPDLVLHKRPSWGDVNPTKKLKNQSLHSCGVSIDPAGMMLHCISQLQMDLATGSNVMHRRVSGPVS